MSSPPFRVRFEAMVKTLRAHPEVEVFDVEIRPPATEEVLRAAEEAVGAALPPAMREFYAAHDGVFLQWGLRGRTYDERLAPFGFPDYGAPPGVINLLPVGDAMSPGWEADSHVNEVQPDHQALLFGAPLDPQPDVLAVIIDYFSIYNHADLVFGPEPVVVVSSDHGADMDSSDFVDFPTYLDVTLAIFGANRYYHGLGIGWTRQPVRVTRWTRPPDLDALLAKLAAD